MHDEMELRADLYVADGLGPQERREVDLHVAACASCAAVIREAADFHRFVTGAIAPDAPPSDLESRVIGRLRLSAGFKTKGRRFPPGRRLLALVGGLAAAGALVFVGHAFELSQRTPLEGIAAAAEPFQRDWTIYPWGYNGIDSLKDTVTATTTLGLEGRDRGLLRYDASGPPVFRLSSRRQETGRPQPHSGETLNPSSGIKGEGLEFPSGATWAAGDRDRIPHETYAGPLEPGVAGKRPKGIAALEAEPDKAASGKEAEKSEVSKSQAPESVKPPPVPEVPSPTAFVFVKPPPLIPSPDDNLQIATAARITLPFEVFEARPAQENRKIVRNAEATIEVDSYDAAYAKLIELVAREKGYVSDGDIQKMPNGKIQANVTVRLPAERFDAVLGRLKEFGTVKFQNIRSEDVTKAYFDHQARLKSKELLLERLKTVLKEAKGTAKELMEVEVQIGSTQEAIDQIKGELRYYDTVVSMSTLTLGLVEKDLAQPFEYVQTLQSNIGLTARDADDAYAKAQKEITDAGGQVVDSRMNRQNDGSATGTIRARVDAEKFPALREALKKLGRVTNDTVNQQRTAHGGQELAPKPDAPVKKEQAVIDLSITTPPLVVTRRAALLVENLSVQEAYPAARRTVESAGGKVTSGSLTGRDASAQATLTAEIDAEKFAGLVDLLKTAGKLKDSRVRLDLPASTPDGQPALLRERSEIELTLVSPPPLIDDDHGIGKTVRDTFAGSWKSVLWSVEKLFVGLSLAGPWIGLALIGWIVWRRVRKKKTATT